MLISVTIFTEYLFSLDRILFRRYSSVEDLTELKIANQSWDEDIKEGRMYPYEERILMEQEKDKVETPPGKFKHTDCNKIQNLQQ